MSSRGLVGKIWAVFALLLVTHTLAFAGPFEPCGSTGLWFSYSPPGDPDEQDWAWGKVFTKARPHGAEYAAGTWRESIGHADVLSLTYNFNDSPPGLYTVLYKIIRTSVYDPCTNVDSPTEVEVISQELGNRHPSFGGTNGVADVRRVVNAWLRAEAEAGRNPLGSYRIDIQTVGVMNGEPTNYQEPITASLMIIRGIGGIRSDGSSVDQCDPREPGCVFNNGTGDGSGSGEPFNYDFFAFLQNLVDPQWWFNLFWPTEEQWTALNNQITETTVFIVLNYLVQSIEGGQGYMFEAGSSEMVGEIGLQIYLPLYVLDQEVPLIIDLEPYEIIINIIRTLIFGSMLFGTLIWTRDRLSSVLSLGIQTLGSEFVSGYNRSSRGDSE